METPVLFVIRFGARMRWACFGRIEIGYNGSSHFATHKSQDPHPDVATGENHEEDDRTTVVGGS